jgi:hypothetical protein
VALGVYICPADGYRLDDRCSRVLVKVTANLPLIFILSHAESESPLKKFALKDFLQH